MIRNAFRLTLDIDNRQVPRIAMVRGYPVELTHRRRLGLVIEPIEWLGPEGYLWKGRLAWFELNTDFWAFGKTYHLKGHEPPYVRMFLMANRRDVSTSSLPCDFQKEMLRVAEFGVALRHVEMADPWLIKLKEHYGGAYPHDPECWTPQPYVYAFEEPPRPTRSLADILAGIQRTFQNA